jgi:AcrR family transcriptional regulator
MIQTCLYSVKIMEERQHTATARERILATAARLFYERGYQAVGVDTIVAESGVAKMTLYRHFPSKDDLIVAYLQHADEGFWRWLEEAVAEAEDARTRLVAAFVALRTQVLRPTCAGCPFQGSVAEFPTPDHPAHHVAAAHKERIRSWFESLATEAGLADPHALADGLLLLMDGAWAAARMSLSANPVTAVVGAAEALIQAHEPGS